MAKFLKTLSNRNNQMSESVLISHIQNYLGYVLIWVTWICGLRSSQIILCGSEFCTWVRFFYVSHIFLGGSVFSSGSNFLRWHRGSKYKVRDIYRP